MPDSVQKRVKLSSLERFDETHIEFGGERFLAVGRKVIAGECLEVRSRLALAGSNRLRKFEAIETRQADLDECHFGTPIGVEFDALLLSTGAEQQRRPNSSCQTNRPAGGRQAALTKSTAVVRGFDDEKKKSASASEAAAPLALRTSAERRQAHSTTDTLTSTSRSASRQSHRNS